MSKHLLLKKLFEQSKKKSSVLDKLLFGILGLGFILMVVFFIYLLWFTLSNRSVTYFLPTEKTVAYFELEDLSLPPTLSQDTVFDLVGLTAILKKSFSLDIKELQDHLAHGRLGVGLIKNSENMDELLLFFRMRNQKQALEFFEGLGLEDEKLIKTESKEIIIYSYPQSQNFVFGFVGPYLFITKQNEILELIQAVYLGEVDSLNADPAYQKSLSNLPRQTWGRGYLNIQALSFGANNPLNQISTSLKHILNHFALTIRKEYNGFHFNTLLSINPDLLALKKGYSDPTRFTYELADYIGSKKIATYIGGANLQDEWESTLETISELNPAYGIIMEGVLRAQVSHIFGDDVSLRNDIYPLFEGEYALALEYLENDQFGIKLILKHDDRNFAEMKLEKLLDGFRLLAAQFAPR